MKQHLIQPLGLAALLACAGTAVQGQQGSSAGGSSAMPGGNIAAAAASSSPRGSTALRANERSFIIKAAADGLYEVEAARLAEQKASDQSVKALASTLVSHHTEANNELMQLASSKGVTLPTALPRANQNELDRLSKLSGSAFDREFLRQLGIAAHQADIRVFQNGSRTAKDPELKAWIDKTLPILRDHLAQAQKTPMPVAGSTSAGGMGAASGSGSAGTGGSMSGGTGTGSGTGTGGAATGGGMMGGSTSGPETGETSGSGTGGAAGTVGSTGSGR